MPCYHPIRGYRAPGGEVKFTRQGAFRDRPITISCGQCTGCRLERSRQWAVRLTHESQMHEHNCFVTLTYDQDHLPNPPSLDLEHWQNFAKKLRSKMRPFRFFHCGEYGDLNKRPHYHAILFGINFSEDRVPSDKPSKDKLWESETLTKTWGKGLAVIGDVTFESAAYVARYSMKKQNGKNGEDHYDYPGEHYGEIVQLKKEYATMSLKPGIGKTWLDKYRKDIYPSDECVINGRVTRPPKYYDRKHEEEHPKEAQQIRVKRKLQGDAHPEDDNYDRRLVKETIATRNLKLKERKI